MEQEREGAWETKRCSHFFNNKNGAKLYSSQLIEIGLSKVYVCAKLSGQLLTRLFFFSSSVFTFLTEGK